ncbi:hypothetical protein K435DRAFT_843407, partial [Dendrothele bispora CBS 962.96]
MQNSEALASHIYLTDYLYLSSIASLSPSMFVLCYLFMRSALRNPLPQGASISSSLTKSAIVLKFELDLQLTNFLKREIEPSNVGGCHMGYTGLLDAAKTAGFWEAIFVYDVIIFILLLQKAHQVKKELALWTDYTPAPSLLNIIVKDGTIYFIIIATANLINIICFYFSDLRS